MTKVTYSRNGRNYDLKIEGHANYAPAGEDIVCAAISTVSHMLCYGLEGNSEYAYYNYSFDEGRVEFKACSIATDTTLRWCKGDIILDTLFCAVAETLKHIAEQYPDNVSFAHFIS